ncbi:DNA topoisomerase IV subunit A [Candidatus Fermentibacteria bacterium]|nr:DNA topoisomerase IV subunit A [Candidatus Fermentibacteria bacterium]
MSRKGTLGTVFRDNFLDYASYVIKERAIPDAADGLKPVQRRILWSLKEMDDGRYSKVANVIGHTMRYHPHGDQSIGNALVHLANTGYFVDRQGNFGNLLTGDEASAPRYIECRLTELARRTMFNDRVTELVPSYDGRNEEPVLLPAKIPVILLLGVEGIAVGMSTRILPHNFCEVLQAQISYLKGKEYDLYPDFPQGGSIDVSDYDRGLCRVRNRARIDRHGRKELVIRELPWGSTTESLIRSIESAAGKGKLKISSIDDYTSDEVEIHVRLGRGVSQEEGLKRLYAHTDCEASHSSSMMVIRDDAPTEMAVDQLLEYCTDRLVEILRRELKLRESDLLDRERWLTLEQLFIENRIYKQIEECDTLEAIRQTVRKGLKPHLPELLGELTREDVDRLVGLKIRRISRFDIESYREQSEEVRAGLREVRKKLRNVKRYAIGFLSDLLDEFGARWPRRTSIESFSDIDVRRIAHRNLKVGFDEEKGFVGTDVRSDTYFNASEYDRVFLFLADGTYRVVPVQDKYFVDGDVVHCGLADREKVFTAVYRMADSRLSYVKRFATGGYILEKEYRYVPEGTELLLFSDLEEGRLEFWFKRKKRMRKFKDERLLDDIRATSSDAKGVRLGGRKEISSVKAVPAKAEEEEEIEEDASEQRDVSSTDSQKPDADRKPDRSIEEIVDEAEKLRRRSADAAQKAGGDGTGDLFEEADQT